MTTLERFPMKRRPARWAAPLLAVLAAVLAVAACGGGVGSGGTGSALGVTAGTVNGFGSIVVDGARFDDRSARVEVENEPDLRVLAEARLGQRVEVQASADGVAGGVRLEAQVRGRVDGIVANGYVVLGQTVVVNTTAANGPVTQFGDGYAQAIDVLVGDAVEVHGIVRGSGTDAVVQATRIDRLDAPPPHLKVAGVVADASSTADTTTFHLGGLTVSVAAAAVEPAGASIRAGRRVVVFGRSGDLSYAAGVPTLVAERVRVRETASGDATYFAGVVADLDTAAKTFVLDGVTVAYGTASLEPSGATLAEGRYVQLRGSFAADGSFAAAVVTLRSGGSTEAELKGTVVGYDAVAGTMSVRDVTVTVTAGTSLECSGGLADGRYVEVHGRLGSNGVIATELHCEDEPNGATVEREGTAGTPDLAASTFSLATSGSPVTVRWTAQTYFGGGLDAASLGGRRVEVEGYFDGSVLVAQKIKPES